MNDPKQVISQLAKRWQAQYGETLGTEEIRRHLSRLLSELQKREIEQVFANWSGEALLDAINATFDMDDGSGVVRTKEPFIGLCPPASASISAIPVEDTEYLPNADWGVNVTNLPFEYTPEQEPVKRRGRPPGAKNKGKR